MIIITIIISLVYQVISSGPKKGTRGSHGPPEGGNNNLGGAQNNFRGLKNY